MVGVQVGEPTTNLIPNPSVETGTTGYTAIGTATFAQSSAAAFVGANGLRVVTAAGGDGIQFTNGGVRIPVSPQTSYAFSVFARMESGSFHLLQLAYAFYDGTSTLVSSGSNAGAAVTTDWSRLRMTMTAPASAATVVVILYTPDSGSVIFHTDAWQLEAPVSTIVGTSTYCDGTQPDCSWTGTPHASTSVRAVNPAYVRLTPGWDTGTWTLPVDPTSVEQYWTSLLSATCTAGSSATSITWRYSLDGGRSWTVITSALSFTDLAITQFSDNANLQDQSLLLQATLSRTDVFDTFRTSPTLFSVSLTLTDTPDSTKRMLGYLPEVFREGTNITAHLRACGAEIDQLYDALENAAANLRPNLADSGELLSEWEQVFGLPDGSSLTDAQRQTRLSARLAGQGICNRQRLQSLVAAYEPNAVSIIEDPYASKVYFRFIGTKGAPVLLADLQLAVAQQLPCNVGPVFEFTYIDWATRDLQNRTWAQVDALNRTWAQRDVTP